MKFFKAALFSMVMLGALCLEASFAHAAVPNFRARANETRQALLAKDFIKAESIVTDVTNESKIGLSGFYPFNDFMNALLPATAMDVELEKSLDEWVNTMPQSAAAHLVRGRYHYKNGWNIRGGKFSSKTPEAAMEAFSNEVKLAQNDFLLAVSANDKNPYAFFLLLQGTRSINDTQAQPVLFQQGISKFPSYLKLYEERLMQLAPKWGGSQQAMESFVKAQTQPLPKDSPLQLLRVLLYRNTVYDFLHNCTLPKANCESAKAAYVNDPAHGAEIAAVFINLAQSHAYSLGEYVLQLVEDGSSKNELYKFKIIEAATKALGSPHYIIQTAYGNIYRKRKEYKLAAESYNAALADVQGRKFPDDDARNHALAGVYYRLAHTANLAKDYSAGIAHASKAIELDNQQFEYFWIRCNAYMNLKQNSAAIADCTQSIALQDDDDNRYDRARTYLAMVDLANAEKDFLATLKFDKDDEETINKAYANLAYIYIETKRYQQVVDLFAQNPTLLTKDSFQLSANLGNSCWANYNLGQMEKAIADCEKSLSLKEDPTIRGNLNIIQSKRQ